MVVVLPVLAGGLREHPDLIDIKPGHREYVVRGIKLVRVAASDYPFLAIEVSLG